VKTSPDDYSPSSSNLASNSRREILEGGLDGISWNPGEANKIKIFLAAESPMGAKKWILEDSRI